MANEPIAHPPETLEGMTDKDKLEVQTEFDVISTLKKMGHEVYPIGLYNQLNAIGNALLEHKPHIAFNLLEEFHGYPLYDQHVVSYLELMRQAYTGCNPRGLTLAHDKALTKITPRAMTCRPSSRPNRRYRTAERNITTLIWALSSLRVK